jgi:predicted small metal-binding protein
MKKLSCRAMGEDCDFVAMGSDEDEVMKKMQEHVRMDHPDKWAEMEQMSDGEKKGMMMDMRQKMEDVE